MSKSVVLLRSVRERLRSPFVSLVAEGGVRTYVINPLAICFENAHAIRTMTIVGCEDKIRICVRYCTIGMVDHHG